jgi:hypothetical protein
VILDSFDHDGVLELRFGYLHSSGSSDAGVGNISIAGYFIGCIDDYNSFLEVVCQHAGRLAQQRGLADAGPSHQEDALARFHEVANYVDRSVDSATDAACKAHDFANPIPDRRNPVERPFDPGAIVPGESADTAGDVLNVFAGNQGIGQIDCGAGISRLGLAAKVENGFDQ